MSALSPTPNMTMNEAEALVLETAMELCREVHGKRRALDVIAEAFKPWSTATGRAGQLWLAFEAAATALDQAENPEVYCDTCKGKGECLVTVKACCKGSPYTRECGCGGGDGEALAECPACEGRVYVGHR